MVSGFRSEGIYGLHAPARSSRRGGFAKNLPLSLRASVFPAKILTWAKPFFFMLLKPDTIHTGSATAYKKKSKVMKSTEKRNRNQKTSNLPLSIGASLRAGLKIVAVALGFHLFGSGFIWAVLALVFCYDILRGILSCLFSLGVLIGFFTFLFSLIF